jgi:hypothetical protein
MEQKNNLYIQLQTEQDTVIELEERVEQLVTQKADFESQMKEMEERLMDEEDATLDDGKTSSEMKFLVDNKSFCLTSRFVLYLYIQDCKIYLYKITYRFVFNFLAKRG